MEETVEEFVTTLPELASRCEFNDMKERTVHDRFVVSLHDQSLSEALQMDPKRILAIAVARATTRKTLKKQQSELQEQAHPAAVGEVKSKRKAKQANQSPSRKPVTRHKSCGYCGRVFRVRLECPAKNATCRF